MSTNTLQLELQYYAFSLLLFSVQFCSSLIMDALATSSNPTNSSDPPSLKKLSRQHWSEQETADLVNFLYEHRSEGADGNFKAQTYTQLGAYLAQKHPGQTRTREALQAKFRSVQIFLITINFILISQQLKDVVAIIDGYNSKSGMGGGSDPARIFVEGSAEESVFSDYVKVARPQVLFFVFYLLDFFLIIFRRYVPFFKHIASDPFHIIRK